MEKPRTFYADAFRIPGGEAAITDFRVIQGRQVIAEGTIYEGLDLTDEDLVKLTE